jgi:cyclase
MLKVRVIPTLLIKGPGLVKGVGFNSWRRVGPVLPAVKVYNTREVDELVIVDISATRSAASPDVGELADIADECFVPLTVGGGVRTVEDARALLRAGATRSRSIAPPTRCPVSWRSSLADLGRMRRRKYRCET